MLLVYKSFNRHLTIPPMDILFYEIYKCGRVIYSCNEVCKVDQRRDNYRFLRGWELGVPNCPVWGMSYAEKCVASIDAKNCVDDGDGDDDVRRRRAPTVLFKCSPPPYPLPPPSPETKNNKNPLIFEREKKETVGCWTRLPRCRRWCRRWPRFCEAEAGFIKAW